MAIKVPIPMKISFAFCCVRNFFSAISWPRYFCKVEFTYLSSTHKNTRTTTKIVQFFGYQTDFFPFKSIWYSRYNEFLKVWIFWRIWHEFGQFVDGRKPDVKPVISPRTVNGHRPHFCRSCLQLSFERKLQESTLFIFSAFQPYLVTQRSQTQIKHGISGLQ